MTFEYIPRGVCSRKIIIDVEDNKVLDVKFIGGCNGNLKGIGALVKGMTVDEVITRLEGIDCNMKGTSCPDQLAMVLKSINK